MASSTQVLNTPAGGAHPAHKKRAPLKYLIRTNANDPTTAIGILLLLLFAYLIVAPIIMLLIDGITVHRSQVGVTKLPEGSVTAYYLWRVFASSQAVGIFWKPLLNTIFIAISAITLSLSVGVAIAWLLVRTNMWGRRWFATALIVPYMLPAWTFALAWATVFKNRTAGGELGWLEASGFSPPNWLAYGHLPIIIIFAIHFSPFVILLVGNALKRFDGTLEEAARMLGASKARTSFTIILPILRPSLISATTLILAKVLGEFGVAYLLGLPVNVTVLATSLYRNVYSNQAGAAAVLAGAIVLIGLLSLWVDIHFLREAKRFVTFGGKGGAFGQVIKLRRLRGVATFACSVVFALTVALPILVLSLTSVMKVPGSFAADNFTLDYWIGRNLPTQGLPEGVLLSSEVGLAAWNSFWIVGSASIVTGILGLLTGYVVVRVPSRMLSVALRQIAFLPYLVPGIAFAVAYLSLFAQPRGPIPALYGTAAILVLIYIAEQMPFSSRAGISAMMQLGSDPEEAARMAGARWWRRFVTIILPIQKNALATGILMPFIAGIKSLSLVIILAVPGMEVLTTLSIRFLDVGYTQAGNAIVLMISAIAFAGTYTVQKLMKADLASGLGG